MNSKNFDELVKRRTGLINKVLASKGEEYSRNGERLWNFKEAAKVTGQTDVQAAWGMAMKHLVSVMDMIDQVGTATVESLEDQRYCQVSVKNFSRDYVDEKIGDLINYLILIEALIVEKMPGIRINLDDAAEAEVKKMKCPEDCDWECHLCRPSRSVPVCEKEKNEKPA